MKIRIGLISLLIVVLITFLYFHQHSKAHPPIFPTASVSVITLHSQSVNVTEEFSGRASAYRVAEIRPQVTGIITQRLFVEGSTVQRGQQLYQIDPTLYQATYDSAKAAREKAAAIVVSTQAKSERYKNLLKLQAVSKQDYDDLVATLAQNKADVAVADAAIATAAANLNFTKMVAPISGRIGKSSVTEGALVGANQASALAVVTQLDPIFVDIVQANEDVQRLRPYFMSQKSKQSVMAKLAGQDDHDALKGQFEFSDVTVDATTGSVQMRAIFPNPNEMILPGMFIRTSMTFTLPDSLLVPERTTSRGADGQLTVWVVSADQTAKPVKISASRTIGAAWLVSAGVKNNDKIVYEGFQKLTPGAKVIMSPAVIEGK
jgi:membrane fusion protein (multidrug efflux system)